MKKYLGIVLFLACFWIQSALAATIVPNAAGGNWSAGGTWVGGSQPTAADDVDYSALTGTLTIDGTSGAPNLCRSFTATASTGTLVQASAKQLNIGDGTTGNFKIVSGLTYAPNVTSVLKFVSTTTGNQITFAGKAFGNMTFDGVGGEWTWQDANTMVNNSTLTLTNGSLVTGNFNTTNAVNLSSSNSNTRSLTLGTSTWNFFATWDIGTSTGMTLSAASSTINLPNNNSTSSTIAFNGGGLTYGTFTSTGLTTGTVTFTGANTFGTLTTSIAGTTKTTISGYVFPAGVTQTVTGTYTAAGSSLILRNFLYSSTLGTAATISAGTFAITNTDLRDITKAGAGSGVISATSSSTGNGDCGGNTGWTFQGTRSVYHKTAVSDNWSAANWYTASGGSTAATPPLPLCHDTAVFDVNSVTAGSKNITVDQPRTSGFSFSGVANTPNLTGSTVVEVYGSYIYGVNTDTRSQSVVLMGRNSYTLNTASVTLPAINWTVNAPSGTYSLGVAFSPPSGQATSVTNGTLALNGFNVNVGAGGSVGISGGSISGTGTITASTFTQSGGTTTLGGTMTLNGALAVSAGTLNMNGNQITGHTTATISSTGTLNLSGQLNGSGSFSITGGTITDSGASGEIKGTTAAFSGGTSALRKATMTSTIAISGTALTTFNPGTFTHVGNLSVASAGSPTFTINGTAVDTAGVMTVTAASAGTTGYAWSQ